MNRRDILAPPHRRPERLRVKKADADRLQARTSEMNARALQRMADSQERKARAAVLAQRTRARVRVSMWLSQSA